MPQEEKEKIKIVPLCRNIGEVIALNGIIFSDEGLLCRLYEPLVCDCHDYMVHCGRL